MSNLDATFNTPAHIDRDEARTVREYDDGFDERADFDPITDGPTAMPPPSTPIRCGECWQRFLVQEGPCEQHAGERATT